MAARGSGQRGPTKNDVEMRRVDMEIDRNARLISGGTTVASIIGAAVPVWALNFVIQPLAGQTTEIKATLPISIGFAVSIGINGIQQIKLFAQRKELGRLRGKKDELEVALLESSEE